LAATRKPAGKPPVRKKKPATPRPVVVTVTTTYRLTQDEYETAVSDAIEGMANYSYGRNRIPTSTKTTVEGVK
jgi:hypothetical protein